MFKWNQLKTYGWWQNTIVKQYEFIRSQNIKQAKILSERKHCIYNSRPFGRKCLSMNLPLTSLFDFATICKDRQTEAGVTQIAAWKPDMIHIDSREQSVLAVRICSLLGKVLCNIYQKAETNTGLVKEISQLGWSAGSQNEAVRPGKQTQRAKDADSLR